MRSGVMLARALPLAAIDAIAAWRLRPGFAALRHDLADPQGWVDRVGGDRAAITLATAGLWLVSLWLGVGLSAALVSRAPGAVGRCARRLARVALPRVVYRVVAGAAGLGVLLTPVAAGAGAAPDTRPSPLPAPTVPVSAVPAPQLPTTPRPASTAPALPQATASDVTVHPGDSLWSLAAARLPRGASDARIAAAWPRWYHANRAEIGPEPDHLAPGQVLHAPPEQEMR